MILESSNDSVSKTINKSLSDIDEKLYLDVTALAGVGQTRRIALIKSICMRYSEDDKQPYLRILFIDRNGETIIGHKFNFGNATEISQVWTNFINRLVMVDFTVESWKDTLVMNIYQIRSLKESVESEILSVLFSSSIENADTVSVKVKEKLAGFIEQNYACETPVLQLLEQDGYWEILKLKIDPISNSTKRGLPLLVIDSILSFIENNKAVFSFNSSAEKMNLVLGFIVGYVIYVKIFVASNEVGASWKLRYLSEIQSFVSKIQSLAIGDEDESLRAKVIQTAEALLGIGVVKSTFVETILSYVRTVLECMHINSRFIGVPADGIISIDGINFIR